MMADPMSEPFDHDAALARLADDVAELRRLEAEVRRRKEALRTDLPRPADPVAARRFAVAAYWAAPEVPTEVLAEIATGLTRGKAVYRFTRGMTARLSNIACDRCGQPVVAHSREQMDRLVGQGLGRCDECTPAKAILTTTVRETPRSNGPLQPFERDLLQLHADCGQSASVSILWGGGTETVTMTPDDLRVYIEDPDLGAARAAGVSREDYLVWLETEGFVQCDAVTRAGARCKNGRFGHYAEDPAQWLQRRKRGGYCTTHGG